MGWVCAWCPGRTVHRTGPGRRRRACVAVAACAASESWCRDRRGGRTPSTGSRPPDRHDRAWRPCPSRALRPLSSHGPARPHPLYVSSSRSQTSLIVG
ncbi:hypothetical protein AMK10_32420 [Streptomyces sp. CB02058]|nr:hypothetical protein AMK10_32420 [Streptomyces sp. CB02058]